jgi:hypothetical protein
VKVKTPKLTIPSGAADALCQVALQYNPAPYPLPHGNLHTARMRLINGTYIIPVSSVPSVA